MDYIDMQTGEESKKEIKQKGRKCSDKAQRDGHACQNGATRLLCRAKVHVSVSAHGRLAQ